MKQRKLTDKEIKALDAVAHLFYNIGEESGCEVKQSAAKLVFDMACHGTNDGEPWVEPVEPQSHDSSKPGFDMPKDWHGRSVLSQGEWTTPGKLIGWDADGSLCQNSPYLVLHARSRQVRWCSGIRFVDQPGQP